MDAQRSPKINNQPLYLQALDAIRSYVEQHGLQPGDLLPPEDRLARELGVSRLTLREALGYLENDGFVERRRGVGTFVRELSGSHFAGGMERLETLRSLARVAGLRLDTVARGVEVVAATAASAAALEVPFGTDLLRVHVTQASRGLVTAHFDSLAPLSAVSLEDVQRCDGSLLEYLLDSGCPLARSRSLIFAENASSAIAAILGVPQGAAVLHLSETFYVANRRPLVLSDNYILTGCFNFYIARRPASRKLGGQPAPVVKSGT